VGFGTPFEGICWTILRQRQYPNVARARLRRLRERFGMRVADSEEPTWAFPPPATVARAPLEAIRREVKSRKKARYLREAATAFAEAGDAMDVLRDPPDELAARLLAIRGVGPWSVRAFLGRAFNRPHLGEVVVDGAVAPYWRDTLARFYGPDVDPALVRERADAYGVWDAYWLFYARFTHHAMRRAVDAAVVDA
jgi:DNA-3-methyladenine glycosylase II